MVTDRDDPSLRKSIRLSWKSVRETIRKNQLKYQCGRRLYKRWRIVTTRSVGGDPSHRKSIRLSRKSVRETLRKNQLKYQCRRGLYKRWRIVTTRVTESRSDFPESQFVRHLEKKNSSSTSAIGGWINVDGSSRSVNSLLPLIMSGRRVDFYCLTTRLSSCVLDMSDRAEGRG